MRSVVLILLLLASTVAKSQTCTYDSKTHEFQFAPGKKIGLIFGTHGTPSYVNEYASSGNAHLATEVRKLLDKHSDNLPKMNATYEQAVATLSKQNTKWIGFENSQAGIESLGGFKGLMEFLRKEDLRLQQLGLSERERRDYAIIMTDPVVAAAYWLRKRQSEQGQEPMAVGFDNHRDPGVEALSKKLTGIYIKYDELRDELDQTALAIPNWVLEELRAFRLGATFTVEPHKAADFLRKILSDPRSASLNRQQKQKIEGLRDFIASNAEFVRGTDLREKAEFAKRDQGIADDVSLLATHNGEGLAHIGANHQRGVIERLTKICESRSRNRQTIRSATGGAVAR